MIRIEEEIRATERSDIWLDPENGVEETVPAVPKLPRLSASEASVARTPHGPEQVDRQVVAAEPAASEQAAEQVRIEIGTEISGFK